MIRDLFFSLRDAFSGGAGGSLRGLIVITVAGLVLAGVIALAIALLSSGSASSKVSRRLSEARRRRVSASPPSAWIWRFVGILLVITTILVANSYLGRNETCLSCHRRHDQKSGFAQGVHQSAKCVACHQPPGVAGGVRQALADARMLYVFVGTKAVPDLHGAPEVENGSCLRCHARTARGDDVRERHTYPPQRLPEDRGAMREVPWGHRAPKQQDDQHLPDDGGVYAVP